MANHIFISYSRKDIEFAGKIVQALADNALDTWVDWKSIPKGEDWWQQIQIGIEEADAFLFLISPDSVSSEVCGDELEHAVANGKRILPIIIRDPEIDSVPKVLSKLNWIFLRDGQDDFDEAIEETRETIQTDYEWLQFHTELQVKALKWQRSKGEKSLLLRGKELEDAESIMGLKAGLEPRPVDLQREFLVQSRQTVNRQRRQITIGLGIGVIVFAILAIFAWNQRNTAVAETNAKATALVNEENAVATAQAERDRAQSGQLATIALSQIESDFNLALLLSVEGIRKDNNFLSRNSLFTVAQKYPNLLRSLQKHTHSVNSVAFSPDGKRLASGSCSKTSGFYICEQGVIRMWDVETWQQIGEALSGHTDWVNSVAFSPDGKRLASGSEDESIRLWNAEAGSQIGEALSGHEYDVYSMAFSPDWEILVSGSDDATIRLWDVETGQQIGEALTGHEGDVTSVAFSPDGKNLASGSYQEIRMWDVETGQQIGEALSGHTSYVNSVAFSPDGKNLASGSSDDTIRMWNVETGQQIGEALNGHTSEVWSMVFSPDGETLASGSADGTIRLLDAHSGQQIGEPLSGHTDVVYSMVFSPDGKMLASGSYDDTIRLWDVETGQQIGEALNGHEFSVRSVAFSPDGKRLASGSDDATIRLWDVETGQQIGEALSGHEDSVYSVAFSPDGKRLASGSRDDTVRLWNIDINFWINAACERATRNITENEWKVYFPGECYRQTCPQYPPEFEDDRPVCQE